MMLRLRTPTTAPEPAHPSERRRAEELERTRAIAERYAAQAHHPYGHRALDAFMRALDQRTVGELTRVGRWLRTMHLDELPQLWNVVRGDMSLVGPRPIRPVFFEQLCEEIPQYWQRLVVRPGLTGFAQLRMARDMSWAEKLAHDLEWLADRSVGLYLRLIVATAFRVLQRGAGDVAALQRS